MNYAIIVTLTFHFVKLNIIITDYAISILNISYINANYLTHSLFDSLQESGLVLYYCFCWMAWWLSFYNVAFFKL